MSSTPSPPKRILVTMATGNQGSAVVRSLAQRNQAAGEGARPYHILAVTRSAASTKAKKLAELPGVTLLESDYVPLSLFEKATDNGASPLYGVFSVQSAMLLPAHVEKGPKGETTLGKQVVDEAVKHKVKHVVYTSVDQGGLPKTDVPHFESKRLIEEHVRAQPQLARSATILRPVAFMDNFSNGETMFGKVMNTFFQSILHKPVQLIAVSDIGEFAARAFDDPQQYAGVTLSLAGDELSPQQIKDTYASVKSTPLPTTFGFLPKLVQLMSYDVKAMFRFFNQHGYAADIEALRKQHAGLKTFKQYVETEM